MRLLNPISSEVFEDFDRIVDSFLRPTYANTVGFRPSCDVNETKDHFLVSFDMPGVKSEDIKINVEGNRLAISGERQGYGKFERSFTLPTSVMTEKIEAHYENGVLSVALPKAEAAKAREIPIQSGRDGFFNKLLGSKTKELKDVKIS